VVKRTALASLFLIGVSFAHHGTATLGGVGLEGPGVPIETSSSYTLPEGHWLFSLKLDYPKFRKYSFENFPDQKDYYQFWTLGIGYGFKPWLSGYLFVPYYIKKEIKSLDENDPSVGQYEYRNAGFADPLIMVVFGFKYDEGFMLPPKRESLDELMDWRFSLYGGISLPTGETEKYDRKRNPNGDFSPDMATGFGKPTIILGFTASKQLESFPKLTFTLDTNYTKFFEHEYNYRQSIGSPRKKYKFGDEFRLNLASVYKLYSSAERGFRIDAVLEANFQYNQKDKEDGIKLEDSGGKILYGTFGGRLYYKNLSLAAGLKLPLWKDLNQHNQQQGAEGKEKYRLLMSLSFTF